MDHRRFDHLARQLGARFSRRGALALAGGAAAAALTGDDALAARATCRAAGASCTRAAQCCSGQCATGRQVERSRRNRCICPENTLACGAFCCPAGSACISGACVTSCTRAEGASICLLTTRSIVQFTVCDLAVIADDEWTCIDDSDCPFADYDPDVRLDHVGCLVSFTDNDGPSTEYAGACITWRTGVDVC